MLNVHPSLLPRWRGAAPIERAIEAGDEETGVTIMRPIAELDAGPICLQRSRADRIPTTTTAALAPRLAALGGELLVEALDSDRRSASSPPRASPTPRRSSRGDRLLDPALGADELERRVRALTPHIGAFVELRRRRAARRAPRGRSPRRPTTLSPGRARRARRARLLYGAAQRRPRAARGAAARASGRWTPPPGCAAVRRRPASVRTGTVDTAPGRA